MAVGPIGNLIYANQMMHIQASKETDYQNSVQMQNVLASAMQQEKDEVVEEVRPTEESYKIDPENEHERQKHDEENAETNEQEKPHEEAKTSSEEEEEKPPYHGLLDVKA
jgi:hypothetical protein